LVLESSRKKYGGHNDQLLSLDPENNTKLGFKFGKEVSSVFKNVKMLQFLEVEKIIPYWPSCTNLQEVIDIFMARMIDVRALNKKNVQKRAFYDLMSYMKDEGLRPNFQKELQPFILDCKEMTPYFYKAYESHVMLKSTV